MNTQYVLAFLAIVILIRIAVDRIDRRRIRTYVFDRGGDVDRIRWWPFGRGWFAEQSARIYRVDFRNEDGAQRRSLCKTRLFGGVYWTDEAPVQRERRGRIV